MPMDPAYIELELDAVEKRGAGRVAQEMAKNPALPGDHVVSPHPKGIPPEQMTAKEAKTQAVVEAKNTQVLRGKER